MINGQRPINLGKIVGSLLLLDLLASMIMGFLFGFAWALLFTILGFFIGLYIMFDAAKKNQSMQGIAMFLAPDLQTLNSLLQLAYLLGGFFIFIPGFLSDCIGFFLLVMPKQAVRFWIYIIQKIFQARFFQNNAPPKTSSENPNDVILEAEYKVLDDEEPPKSKPKSKR